MQPNGTEGYRTAEVTLGVWIQTNYHHADYGSAPRAGLYFIGEVMDVTGCGWAAIASSGRGRAPGPARIWRLSEDNKVVHKALKL